MELNKLISFTAANCGVDQLVSHIADLNLLKSAYAEVELEAPEWVDAQLDSAKAQVDISVKAAKRAKLLKLQSRRAALATPQEQRKSIDDEIAELEAKLK